MSTAAATLAPHTEAPAEPELALSLKVIGGHHNGAQAPLSATRITMVGSASDCEICLVDPGVNERHFAISNTAGAYVIRSISGAVRHNRRLLGDNTSAQLRCGDLLQIADTQVQLQVTSSTSEPGKQRQRIHWWLALPLILLLPVLAVTHGYEQDTPAAGANVEQLLVQTLQALSLQQVVQISHENDQITLKGVVTDTDHKRLYGALQTLTTHPATTPVVNHVLRSSALVEQVRNVFRTNGLHPELAYAGNAVVTVAKLNPQTPHVQQVIARVTGDVPALHKLEFVDTETPMEAPPFFVSDPDKRLTTFIDGATAYVATTDGARYFAGAVLPGGGVLLQITAKGIQVQHNGHARWMQL